MDYALVWPTLLCPALVNNVLLIKLEACTNFFNKPPYSLGADTVYYRNRINQSKIAAAKENQTPAGDVCPLFGPTTRSQNPWFPAQSTLLQVGVMCC